MAPRILSFTLTNQTVAFNWSTFMNNTYDIQSSPDLVNWSKFQTGIVAWKATDIHHEFGHVVYHEFTRSPDGSAVLPESRPIT